MFEIVKAGGIMMGPIILASIVTAAIFLERLWTLQTKRVLPAELTEKVWRWVEQGQIQDKHIAALQQNSPLGKILAAGLANRNRERGVIREAIEDTGRHVVHELDRFIGTVGTIASLSPLMGLLGTVFGMIRTFNAITTAGIGNPASLAGGIAEALITTAAGLTVAIPALLAYKYLRGRVQTLVVQMEKEAIKLVEALEAQSREAAMNLRPKEHEEPEMNLTSLIDVVLLLLIFFMVSTTFVDESRIKLQLPQASNEPAADQKKDPIEVAVTATGEYRVNGQVLINTSPATLSAAVSKLAGERRDLPVTIRADARSTHQSVVTAMDVLGRLGFKAISIATVNDQSTSGSTQ